MVEEDACGVLEINGQVSEGGRQVVNGMRMALDYVKGSQRRREVIKWHAIWLDKQFMKGRREVVKTNLRSRAVLRRHDKGK